MTVKQRFKIYIILRKIMPHKLAYKIARLWGVKPVKPHVIVEHGWAEEVEHQCKVHQEIKEAEKKILIKEIEKNSKLHAKLDDTLVTNKERGIARLAFEVVYNEKLKQREADIKLVSLDHYEWHQERMVRESHYQCQVCEAAKRLLKED